MSPESENKAVEAAALESAGSEGSVMKIIKEGVELGRVYSGYSSRLVRSESKTMICVERDGENGYVIKSPGGSVLVNIDFQDGTPLVLDDDGLFDHFEFNGATVEAVLAVALDRLEYLNGCVMDSKNHDAIKAIKEAMRQLDARTRDREQRGVEGTDAT